METKPDDDSVTKGEDDTTVSFTMHRHPLSTSFKMREFAGKTTSWKWVEGGVNGVVFDERKIFPKVLECASLLPDAELINLLFIKTSGDAANVGTFISNSSAGIRFVSPALLNSLIFPPRQELLFELKRRTGFDRICTLGLMSLPSSPDSRSIWIYWVYLSSRSNWIGVLSPLARIETEIPPIMHLGYLPGENGGQEWKPPSPTISAGGTHARTGRSGRFPLSYQSGTV